MEPISMGLGLGLAAIGTVGSISSAKQEAGISQQEAAVSGDIAAQQMAQNGLRQQQMELTAKRSQMEVMRNAQRARAMAVQSGVSQGASFGSGVAGGVADATNRGNYNLLGIGQNLSLGRQNFGLENNISQDKLKMATLQSQMASAQGDAAMWQGLTSMGGSLLKAGPTLGNLFSGNSPGPSGVFSGGGNNGMAPTWV